MRGAVPLSSFLVNFPFSLSSVHSKLFVGGLSYETTKGTLNFLLSIFYFFFLPNVKIHIRESCIFLMSGETRCRGGCLRPAVKTLLPISETLTDYFNTFGEVVGVEIKMDALTGRSRLVLTLLCIFTIVNRNFS